MDILKIRGKPRKHESQIQDDIVRMQNAYQKIIFKRMPILPRLLQDFGVKNHEFHEYSLAKIRAFYGKRNKRPLQSKFYDYQPIFSDLENRKGRYTGPDEGLFEEVRNDRLKVEILVDFDMNIDTKTNLSFLESIQEMVVSLGDREIFTKKIQNSYTTGNGKIINLLSILYPKKEQWAAKNIYTTIRINGQSIRSFMYTMNNLFGKDMSGEDLYIFYSADRKDVVRFPEFIKTITGKSLLDYGGSQSKLGKSLDSNKENIYQTLEELFKEKYKRIMEGGKSSLNDIEEIKITMNPQTRRELENLVNQKVIFYPKFPREKIMVINSFKKLPPRKLVTRERQAKEKDFSVKFPVYDLEIYYFEIPMFIGDLEITVRFNSKKLENDIISKLKNKTKGNYQWHQGIITYTLSSDRQKLDFMYNKPNAKQEIHRKYRKKIEQGNLSPEEHMEYISQIAGLEDRRTEEAANRKIQSDWRKKLRRKQFPHNLLYIKYKGKYLGLYSTAEIYNLKLRS